MAKILPFLQGQTSQKKEDVQMEWEAAWYIRGTSNGGLKMRRLRWKSGLMSWEQKTKKKKSTLTFNFKSSED